MIRYVTLPLIFLLAFIFESFFLFLIPNYGIGNQYVFVPHFLFITLLFCAIFYRRNVTLVYACIFGFIFDIFYTDLIGVYAYLFPLTVYLVCKLTESFHKLYFIVFVFSTAGIMFMEFIGLGIHTAIGRGGFTLEEFMYMRLWPTLITNLTFTLLFGYMLQRIFMKLLKIEEKKR